MGKDASFTMAQGSCGSFSLYSIVESGFNQQFKGKLRTGTSLFVWKSRLMGEYAIRIVCSMLQNVKEDVVNRPGGSYDLDSTTVPGVILKSYAPTSQ